ncbi:MAG TPA: glycoside hydrolase family 32 protein [Chitinophagaceae bacterium]|nr:glycoside hydrolase family 32 protein [Chitinophagaceae bacterium]
MKPLLPILLGLALLAACPQDARSQVGRPPAATASPYNEPHRPRVHFSPPARWMNDPNGMVFFNNRYHLFYQYYPDSTVWGPMHWGHAESADLVHWQHRPVALYPDSLGYIFSGSAVVDRDNTSGFGKGGKPPLVAIFTHHDPKGEKEGRNDFQVQSLAYSLDEGKTWTKYAGNPVLPNPGIRDFRDPKVMWYEAGKKWIMTLATLDRITFYASPDLKSWTRESDFGKDIGAHGGVWECPDLFPLEYKGKTVWVLLVSINPGGPNGGSATQYFTGSFDGRSFRPSDTLTRWVDYGPDNYAGVTWSHTGKRKIFLGWMNNWQYANVVPTQNWRGAATLPRDLGLEKIGAQYFLTSRPVAALRKLEAGAPVPVPAGSPAPSGSLRGPARLELSGTAAETFALTFSNAKGDSLVIGYDAASRQYYIDRTHSGQTDFEKGFARRHTAPRISGAARWDMTVILDQASVELFADGGLTAMTAVFFPQEPLRSWKLRSPRRLPVRVTQVPLSSIWDRRGH